VHFRACLFRLVAFPWPSRWLVEDSQPQASRVHQRRQGTFLMVAIDTSWKCGFRSRRSPAAPATAISFAAHSASKRDLSAARLSGVSAVPPLQASSRRELAKGLA
jgi:hypothetical protein